MSEGRSRLAGMNSSTPTRMGAPITGFWAEWRAELSGVGLVALGLVLAIFG
jgi:hypothetical protein